MKNEIMEAAAWAVVLTSITILITIGPFLILSIHGYLFVISNLLLLEFAILLVLGGCMMGRQPLRDEDRYDAEGQPVFSWKWALIGRKMLIASVFMFALTTVFFLLGTLV